MQGTNECHHDMDPKYIQCGNGAADLIYRICACFAPGKALITAPAFSEYERAVLAYGGQIVQHPLREESYFDVDDGFLDAITNEVQLVFLCSPNNPTGRLIDRKSVMSQSAARKLVLIWCWTSALLISLPGNPWWM